MEKIIFLICLCVFLSAPTLLAGCVNSVQSESDSTESNGAVKNKSDGEDQEMSNTDTDASDNAAAAAEEEEEIDVTQLDLPNEIERIDIDRFLENDEPFMCVFCRWTKNSLRCTRYLGIFS
jgi:hypothetical protein